MQLVLRNPLDTIEEPTRGTNIAALFGLSPQMPQPLRIVSVARPPALPPTVVVYSGTKRSEQVIAAAPQLPPLLDRPTQRSTDDVVNSLPEKP